MMKCDQESDDVFPIHFHTGLLMGTIHGRVVIPAYGCNNTSSSSSSVPDTNHVAGYEQMTSIVLGPLSSPLLPAMSVQFILCPHLCCLSIVVWVCLCFLYFGILHVVHCVEFGNNTSNGIVIQLHICVHLRDVRLEMPVCILEMPVYSKCSVYLSRI